MKFSLVHPSRGRPEQAAAAAREWRDAKSAEHSIEHLLSVDDDDPDLPGYEARSKELNLALVRGPNRTLVEAANRAAVQASGDVLIVVSDDFGCPQGWDESLAAILGGRRDLAVLVNDALGARIMTLPIMGSDLYRRLGYVYHPAYHGQFVDEDLTETARALGALIEAKTLVFPHRHFMAGRSSVDATYLRHNHPRSWWSGWRTFQQRKLQGFGVREPVAEAARLASRIELYVRLRVFGSTIRRLWLQHLPSRLVGWEQRFRNATLRILGRALKVSAPA